MLHIGFEELLFVKHFECDDELRLLLSRQVDVAKLSTTEGLANLEVVNGPILRFKLLGWFETSRGRLRGSVLFVRRKHSSTAVNESRTYIVNIRTVKGSCVSLRRLLLEGLLLRLSDICRLLLKELSLLLMSRSD